MIERHRYCPTCDREVLARREQPSHVLHLLLSIITLGLWLLVWFAIGLLSRERGYHCPFCGSATISLGAADRMLRKRRAHEAAMAEEPERAVVEHERRQLRVGPADRSRGYPRRA